MQNMRIVILAGQSNMAGRGVPEPEDLVPIPGVFALNEKLEWVPAVEPVTFDRPKLAGVSCGRAFAKMLLGSTPCGPVGLVPAAVGGSPISLWKPGAEEEGTGKHPYDDALRMAEAARPYGEIVAVLWHQGENDAVIHNDRYAADLEEVVLNFRRDLKLPDLPFICGELGKFLKGTRCDYPPVEEGIRQVVSKLPRMGLVSSEGLNDKGDKLHFDTPSQRIFGKRYFEEYLRIIGKRPGYW